MNPPSDDGLDNFLSNEGLSEIEAMVRAAGGYVAPSTDLRPRVLGAVRTARTARRRRGQLAVFGGVLLLVGTVVAASSHRLNTSLSEAGAAERIARLTEGSADDIRAHRASVDGIAWRLVEAFTAVRAEQAAALQPERESGENAEPAESVARTVEPDASY